MSIIKLVRQDEAPYAQIPNGLIRNPLITPGAFRLMAYLMSHQDGYSLTIEQIERQTGMGKHQINEGRKNLEAHGWLITKQETYKGRFLPKTWTLLNPTAADFSIADNSVAEKPAHKNTNNLNIDIKKTTVKNLDQDFQQFWNNYPKKTAKLAAQKAFIKALDLVSAETLINAALAYAQDPNLPEPKYIKHPATWLNAGCWDDPPLPADPKKKPKTDWEALREYARKLDEQNES